MTAITKLKARRGSAAQVCRVAQKRLCDIDPSLARDLGEIALILRDVEDSYAPFGDVAARLHCWPLDR
jgi:hypothetical protein